MCPSPLEFLEDTRKEKSPSKSNVLNIPETIPFSRGNWLSRVCSSSWSKFFQLAQDNLCNWLQLSPIFVESVTPPGHSIFQTWSTISISTLTIIESSRYHSHTQEHNSGHCKRSQCVDHVVIESRMTHTVNRNPRVYKISRGDKDRDICIYLEISS